MNTGKHMHISKGPRQMLCSMRYVITETVYLKVDGLPGLLFSFQIKNYKHENHPINPRVALLHYQLREKGKRKSQTR